MQKLFLATAAAWTVFITAGALAPTAPEPFPGHASDAPPAARTEAPKGPPFSRLVAPEHLSGTVVELLPAGSYLYVAVEDGARTTWIATLKTAVEVGAIVDVTVYGRRTDFASKRTGRVFPELGFGLVRPR